MELPQLRRCCIEKNGIGMQLGEEAQLQYGHRVEVLHVTSSIREKLAFGLRNAFESLALKIPVDAKLRADLHGIKKTSSAAALRLDGETDDSHCDRFWAKALRQHAARGKEQVWAMVA